MNSLVLVILAVTKKMFNFNMISVNDSECTFP